MNARRAWLFFLAMIVCSSGRMGIAREVVYALLSNGRVEKYDTAGTPLGGFDTNLGPPSSIAVDSRGDIYVTDFFPTREVVHFNRDGLFLEYFDPLTLLPGEGPPASPVPLGLAIGPDGNLYVGVNSITDRVERFAPDGTSLGIFATTFSGAPFSLAFDNAGNLFVETGNAIRRYDRSGMRLSDFVTSSGFGTQIAFDSTGNLYRFYILASSISVFSPSGEELRTIDPTPGISTTAVDVGQNDILYLGGALRGFPPFTQDQAVIRKFLPDGTPSGTIAQVTAAPGISLEVIDIEIVNEIPEPTSILLIIAALCGSLSTIRRTLRRCV